MWGSLPSGSRGPRAFGADPSTGVHVRFTRYAAYLRATMKCRLSLLMFFLSPSVGARADVESVRKLPVVDLRVGLSRAMFRDPSLATGVGQAGYVERKKGRRDWRIASAADRRGRFRSQHGSERLTESWLQAPSWMWRAPRTGVSTRFSTCSVRDWRRIRRWTSA